jgi:hypothetical protein
VSNVPDERQSYAKTLAQLWGIFLLGLLFGMGAYRLIHKGYVLVWGGIGEPINYPGMPVSAGDYFLFALLILLGIGKSWAIFHRKMVPRTLARGRKALGETGSGWDYLFAPFCMLSLYRPWQRKHAILSWVLIPLMVGLAISFIVIVKDSVFKAAVDLAVGIALAYATVLYAIALVRVLWWAVTGAKLADHPLPESCD